MKLTLQARRRRVRIRAVDSDDITSPRDGSCLGIIADWSKYGVGTDFPNISAKAWSANKLAAGDVCVMLPVYAYVHSNIRISTTPYNDRWDSGQIGFIYCYWERVRYVYNIGPLRTEDSTLQDWAKAELEQEIYRYDAYLNGEVFDAIYEVESPRCAGTWFAVHVYGDYYGRDTYKNGMRASASVCEQHLFDNAVWEE